MSLRNCHILGFLKHWEALRAVGNSLHLKVHQSPLLNSKVSGVFEYLEHELFSLCRSDARNFQAYKSLKDGRIAFVAVTGEGRPAVTSFLKENDLGVPLSLGDEEMPRDLPVPGVPTTFILDSNGSVAFMHAGRRNWDDDSARVYLRNLAMWAQPVSSRKTGFLPQPFQNR
jgi:hypothetical protein